MARITANGGLMAEIVRGIDAWEAELGRRLRESRKQQRLSQRVVAELANVSMSAVKALEGGRGSTLATFIRVVRALGLDDTLDRLFTTTATVDPIALLREQQRGKSGTPRSSAKWSSAKKHGAPS
jgi:transcriptional regulator with XRE-family HTH domain